MDKQDQAAAVEALIVAVPETAGSALYGMLDVLAATGNLWQQLVGMEAPRALVRPRIVSLSREPFRCGNGIPVEPHVGLDTSRRPISSSCRSSGWLPTMTCGAAIPTCSTGSGGAIGPAARSTPPAPAL